MNFFKDKLKFLEQNKENKKIENIIFLIVILIITIIIINTILKKDTKKDNNEIPVDTHKVLAEADNNEYSNDLNLSLASILTTIKGVGRVNVFINYSESSKVVAMYDEKTTKSSTEETDSSGGLRNITSTEIQKDVIFSEENGNQIPITEKVIMPTIEGAIITAEGASNSMVRTNIISAVQAATGLSVDKIQVFEMK